MFSICIITFKKRFESLKRMIDFTRRCDQNIPIIIGINGEVDEDFDDEYRKGILNLCGSYKNIYPFFFQEFRSLAKLWNNLVIFSKTEYNFILNDDILFDENQNYITHLNSVLLNNKEVGIFTINGSFSHFMISKTLLDDIGYFDERFLLHGEEDGDFVFRYIERNGNYPPNLNLPIMINIHQTGTKDETTKTSNVELGYANKPKFNQEFTLTKYKYNPGATISGMYGRPHERVMGDEGQYPYEKFFLKNKKNFKKFISIIIEE